MFSKDHYHGTPLTEGSDPIETHERSLRRMSYSVKFLGPGVNGTKFYDRYFVLMHDVTDEWMTVQVGYQKTSRAAFHRVINIFSGATRERRATETVLRSHQ